MSALDLCYLSAAEALERFREKTLSPVELMQAVIDRAEAVAPKLKAHTFTFYDQALEQARASEARYAKGAPLGPLDGVPTVVKDEGYIEGQPTSGGSLLYEDAIADHTSPVNQRVLDAGAIVHARSAAPEFSCAGYCWSKRWGVTRNPWNLDLTPGGSSGGSGASLASGAATLATGSDIGGSIRIPASCSGVVGYKPPYGRNPEEPPFNLDFYCHNGPMARSVSDAILMQNVMCGPHAQDIATLKPKLDLARDYPPIRGMRLAYSRNLDIFEIDPEVARNTDAAVGALRDLGAEIEEVELGWAPELIDAGLTYLEHLFGATLMRQVAGAEDKLTSYGRAFARKSLNTTAADYVRTLEVAGAMYATLGPILERCDALVCPTTAIPAVAADHDQSQDALQINGVAVNSMIGWVLTMPFNMLSRCPVLSVPSGRAANGCPTGLQIVGRTYCDGDVFRIARAYEAAVGPWYASAEQRPTL